jgi:hypothetical protein
MSRNNSRILTLFAILAFSACLLAIEPQTNPEYDPGAMRKNASNADSPVFPGAVTVNGVLTASDSAVIGTSTAQAGYDLTVASGAYLANVVATGTLTIPLVAPADPQPGMLWFEP